MEVDPTFRARPKSSVEEKIDPTFRPALKNSVETVNHCPTELRPQGGGGEKKQKGKQKKVSWGADRKGKNNANLSLETVTNLILTVNETKLEKLPTVTEDFRPTRVPSEEKQVNISTLSSKVGKGGKRGDAGGGFPKPSLSAEQKQALEKRLASKDPLAPAPRTRNEMLKDPFRDEYILAEKEELGNLQELGTFALVDRKTLPRHAKILKTKCSDSG